MDSYYFFEEKLITKMHSTFIQRYGLDNSTAAQLAWDILEILKVSDTNLNDFETLYLQ
ncbi:MAG: hypothetical protein HON90_07410 [Halobacteriovoraceae bacterium]|jgi:hypothetical protein|nr:hypothetical protein [Halobacteriovoraceae bacterium]